MTQEDEYLLRLLSGAINEETVSPASFNPVDWVYIYQQSIHHNILPLIYTSVNKLPVDQQPPFMQQWKVQTIAFCATSIRKRMELLLLLDEFMKADIEVLLYKGLVISELYPESNLRLSGDVDLLVKQENVAKAMDLLLKQGYQRSKDNEEKQFFYFISPDGLVIDLQTRVWNYYSNKDRAISEFIEATAWRNCAFMTIDGYKIRTLGIQEHLFCIICHAAKHFISTGIGIRHLTDIALYVKKYYEVIDWQDLWDELEKIRLNVFVIALFQINAKYFGADRIPDQYQSVIPDDVLDHLLEDLLDAGIFGTKTQKRREGNLAVREAYYFGRKVSRIRVLLLTAFPSVERLTADYSYAKKFPVLFPIAWIHKGFKKLFGMDRSVLNLGIFDRADTSIKRLELLEQLSILSGFKET